MPKKFFTSCFILFITFVFINSSSAQFDGGTSDINELHLVVGEIETISVGSLTRVSVAIPEVADVAEVDDTGMEIIAKNIGSTNIFYWDKEGKNTIKVFVYEQELDVVKNRIKSLLNSAEIESIKLETNEKEGKVVLSGNVPKYQKDKFDKILESFGDKVIDISAPEDIEDLIQIDMQITELSTTLSRQLGIDWYTGTQTVSGNTVTTTVSDGFQPGVVETLPDSEDRNGSNIFKIGDFIRPNDTTLVAKINALIEEGKGRILSKPKLVVVSGEEASFLVGGEIPIRSTTVSETGSVEDIEYKDYGIGMTITPTLKKGKIDTILNVEISDIDRANAVGDDVAFTTRTAQTRLFLDDRETVVLAGLIKQSEGQNVRRIPFLSKIPIAGILFRSKTTPAPNEDLEIVISLTPTLLTKGKNKSTQQKDSEETARKPKTVTHYNPGANYMPGIPQDMVDYVKKVQQRISNSIVYPAEAEQYGWEGTVKVGLLILPDGTLAYASIRESSGYELFDESALNIAKNVAAPYASFPADSSLQELDITIPIVYSLKK